MHVAQVHPVTKENEFHRTRLYRQWLALKRTKEGKPRDALNSSELLDMVGQVENIQVVQNGVENVSLR